MPDSVKRYNPRIPMAASIALRGAMKKQIVLKVHKVFFY